MDFLQSQSQSQLEFPNVGTCKRSKRILDKSEKLLSSVSCDISKLIGNCNNYNNVKEKLTGFINIYEVINKNFEIFGQFEILITPHSCSTKRFLFIVYQKKEEVINKLKKEMEKGKKIKLLYNKFLKVSSVFERKYFDNIFNSMKNKKNSTVNINDCPICLEVIEKKEIVTTNCNHCFHKKCLLCSLINKKACPICRSTI